MDEREGSTGLHSAAQGSGDRFGSSRFQAAALIAFFVAVGVALGVVYSMVLTILVVPLGAVGMAVYRTVRRQQSLQWWIAVGIWLATMGVWYSGHSIWLAVPFVVVLMIGGVFALGRNAT